jgi:hypothetical protein
MKNAGYLFLVLVSGYCFAQSSGIGTNTPVPSSVFEVKSAAGGFLGPRLNSMQRDAIISPAEGLMIYNTMSAAMSSGTAANGLIPVLTDVWISLQMALRELADLAAMASRAVH